MKRSLSLICFLVASDFAFAQIVRYPQVVSVSGKVQFSDVQEKLRPVQRSTQFIEKAKIETGNMSQITLKLDPTRHVTIEENSSVQLPSIGWDSQQIPLILLKSGSLVWKSTQSSTPYSIALSSDLFQFILPQGEFRFSYEPQAPSARVQVLIGEINFSALNSDESVLVKQGQEVTFQGVFEDGEIAYDLLLKGKKIPKGQLLAVKSIEQKELKKREQALVKERLKEKTALLDQQKKKQQRLAQGIICANPDGKLNQCAWVCEGASKKAKTCPVSTKEAQCFRVKCNANGTWSERSLVDAATALQRCTSPTSVVSECDY